VLASAVSKAPGTRDCEHGGSCGVEGLVAVAQASEGSIENLLAVGEGRVESALAQSDVAHWAYTGDAPPPGPRCRGAQSNDRNNAAGAQLLHAHGRTPNLRLIAALFPEDVHIVVRAAGPIASIKDLRGKRVALGEPGSGTLADARLVLAAVGLGECDLEASYPRLSLAAQSLASGGIDAFFVVGGPPVPAVAELASLTPIRLVPIDSGVAAGLAAKWRFLGPGAIAGRIYGGIDDATPTVAVTALWVVGAQVADDLVYGITRSLWQDMTRRLLEYAHPAGKRIRLDTALAESDVPLHPGAARYYRERGVLPPGP